MVDQDQANSDGLDLKAHVFEQDGPTKLEAGKDELRGQFQRKPG